MQATQDHVFKGDQSYVSYLGGRIANDACDVQLHDLHWTEAGSGTIQSNRCCFLEMLFFPENPLRGTYTGSGAGGYSRIGELVFVPPGASLTYDWVVGRQRTISCMFDVSKLSLLSGIDWDWSGINLAGTLDVRNPYLLMSMRKLRDEAKCPGFASELQVDALLAVMALELRRQFVGTEQWRPYAGRLDQRSLRMIDDLINSRRGPGPTLDELAAECQIPARQLSAMFKNRTGVTLRSYAACARVKKAKLYLKDSRLLIKEIAYRSGFQSAAGFATAFRKSTGMSPAEYRAQSGYAPPTSVSENAFL